MRWSKTSPIMIALFTVLLVTVSAAQVNGKNATMYRASKLMGTAVENPQGEHLGTNEASPQQAAGYHKEGHCL